METLCYGDFSLGLQKQVESKRVPIISSIEITRRCPLQCVYCYNNLPMGDKEVRLKELTYKEHCRILDEITEAGCLWLLYTGGEIFARKDFLDIYTYAKKKGMLITLFTNGTLLTPEVVDYLAEWRPFSIEITLYGRTKETYERITRIPGSYEKCMRGIHLLADRGLPLKLKTTVITLNKHEIWEIKEFVEQVLGLEFRFDAMINPRVDCSQVPLTMRLTPQEVLELDVRDNKRMAAWMKYFERFKGPVRSLDRYYELYPCGGGISAFAIDPYGEMSICMLSRSDTWNLRDSSFREGWERFLLKVRRNKITKHNKCVSCEIKAMCGMCPAIGGLENRDEEEPVDFLCQVAHLRAYAFGFLLKPHGECEYCKGGRKYEEMMNSVTTLNQDRR
jgi:radical SAM protein with 4Fe4S-binding SPASM domain